MGAGTRNSPIAIDDSEEEVFHELYQHSDKQSPLTSPTNLKEERRTSSTLPIHYTSMDLHNPPTENPYTQVDKKRKRASSLASTTHDSDMAGPSNGQSQHASLVNRLSQPESKKARKRRRKAERQALEEARLQNINWLGNTVGYPSASQLSNLSSTLMPQWPMDISYPTFSQPQPAEDLSYTGSHREGQDALFLHPYAALPEPRRPVYVPPPLPPPVSASKWVSSMTWATKPSVGRSKPSNPTLLSESGLWSPPRAHAPLPPDPPPPIPPTSSSKPSAPPPPPAAAPPRTEQHALPSKPPPPKSSSHIGMMPDLDPSSKHGTFQFTASTKEVGGDIKKRKPSYLPNPARTLVIEQLPKTHRNPDFVKSWSRNACGSLPVHIFLDSPSGKALMEFATAELARKAWSSPKLGANLVKLKPPQLKGKAREDQIKVWWYRVEGVGADAGVGEIEEGEIEGDVSVEKEVEVQPKKESKKERKARLAREREAKRLRKEEHMKAKEQQQGPQGASSTSQSQSQAVDPAIFAPGQTSMPPPYSYSSTHNGSAFDIPSPIFTSWTPAQAGVHSQGHTSMPTNNHIHDTGGPSRQTAQDDYESAVSSHTRTAADYDELDEEVDMDMDLDDVSPVSSVPPPLPIHKPVVSSLPLHSSLPPRPPPPSAVQQAKAQVPTQKPTATAAGSAARRFITPPPIETLSNVPFPPKQQPRRMGATQPTQRPQKGAPAAKPPPTAQPPSSSSARTNRRGGPIQAAEKPMIPPITETLSLNPPQKMTPSDPQSVLQQPSRGGGPTQGVKKVMLASHMPSKPMSSLQRNVPPAMDVPRLEEPMASLSVSGSNPVPQPSALPAALQRPAPPPPNNLAPASSTTTAASTVAPPSEPKSMKNAPTEPSFTKRALMARQKELEAKIAQSKMELAAATNKGGPAVSANATVSAQAQSQSVTHAKPSMDVDEKQAMEDRLRKLVLQSRKPAVQAESPSTPAATPSSTPTSSDQHQLPPRPPNTEAQGEQSAVPVSAPTFSLEDMAVSFITQTIETMKARPGSFGEVPHQPAPAKSVTQSQADVRSELAAKQHRLEEHIAESKRLMTQLSRAHTKSEKENIMRVMREKTRQFEEESARSATFSTATGNSNTFGTKTFQQRTTTQQFRITRWPGSCQDMGLLIVSDDEDEDEEDDD